MRKKEKERGKKKEREIERIKRKFKTFSQLTHLTSEIQYVLIEMKILSWFGTFYYNVN